MKKLLSLLTMALLVMPMVLAAGVGTGLGGDIEVEEFDPLVFQCGQRVLVDEDIQPWRITGDGNPMTERAQQYLFEGERYQVDVLVFDKNKIEDMTVDLVLEGEEYCTTACVPQFDGGCEEVETCVPYDDFTENCERATVYYDDCNVRIGEERPAYDATIMQGYRCTIDIQPSEQMYGSFWMTVEATSSLTDLDGSYAEIARWFINPVISLAIEGDLSFDEVRPGTASYSTVLLENEAEGGVLLDMFVTGKNWPSYDTMPLARCQDLDGSGNEVGGFVNYLPLGAFRYYAENGAYSTRDDALTDNAAYDTGVSRAKDAEGYVNIQRQLNAGFQEEMFDEAEVIQAGGLINGAGYSANVIYPGSAGMSVTFRLELPEPCYGNFESESDGSIFFWGEAI